MQSIAKTFRIIACASNTTTQTPVGNAGRLFSCYSNMVKIFITVANTDNGNLSDTDIYVHT